LVTKSLCRNPLVGRARFTVGDRRTEKVNKLLQPYRILSAALGRTVVAVAGQRRNNDPRTP
jgi:hypothetical protein